MIRFNNHLTTLRLCDKRDVSQAAEKVDHHLLRNKSSTPIINDVEEKAKLQFEQSLVLRVKYEEEEKKRKQDEEEDSKFDYMTLLVNSTKKYGNLRKGVTTNGTMTFKHSMTKKIMASAGPSK